MARTRFRFRKTFPLLGRLLTGTVSRRGVSLNLRLGLFSRSWGTRGTTTTIDVPATSGIFFRKEERRRKPPSDPLERELHEAEVRRRRWRRVWICLLWLTALIGLGRYGIEALGGCAGLGGLVRLAILIGLQAVLISYLYRRVALLRSILIVVVMIALGYLQWRLHGIWISPPGTCP
ncbi:hypothetical protein [Miltoncostaea oceani]|uniref:hypothetical protein n=1 Tax=Miltoncostaea oceani TaxID=2843216 RepID=UPI001C3E2657|nr:hypothetical protein [Miltoncostaea oceani]